MTELTKKSQAANTKQLSQPIANLIVLVEEAIAKLETQKLKTDEQITQFKSNIESNLDKVNTALEQIAEIMTATGAARWRLAAAQVCKDSAEHNKEFRHLLEDFKGLAREAIIRLEHIAIDAEKRVTLSLENLSEKQDTVLADFQKRAESSYANIENVGSLAIRRLKKALAWFRWDRLGSILISALLASMLTAMYIKAELPWESNSRIQHERSLGKQIISAWPNLSPQEQEQIKRALNLH